MLEALDYGSVRAMLSMVSALYLNALRKHFVWQKLCRETRARYFTVLWFKMTLGVESTLQNYM